MPALTNNNHDVDIGPSNGLDGDRITAETFANVLARAYLDSSDEVRKVIEEMARIIADESVEKDERDSAVDTLTEALFPQKHKGDLGIDLEDVKLQSLDGTDADAIEKEMNEQEATFATRLAALMEQKGFSQQEVAERTGVGQPAISMMLARNCRPQRRTIEKLAHAFGVDPTDLWPD